VTINNCRLYLEDRELLSSLPQLPQEFRTFARPSYIDVDWHKSENQGPIGSCQGNGLTSCLERLQFVRTGSKDTVVQLSRIFAYLATQKLDGLLGSDRGSTISRGVKLALTVGAPPETLTGYPRSYPARSERDRILSPANYAAGSPYKAHSSWQCPEDPEEAMNFIGGGGAISLGISWYNGIIPSDRIVKQFRPPGSAGGHAMFIGGYTQSGNLIGVNSHGDGPYQITPSAWRQMMLHRWTAAIGLVGTEEPAPVELDWSMF
jgi:hypothetical protein